MERNDCQSFVNIRLVCNFSFLSTFYWILALNPFNKNVRPFPTAQHLLKSRHQRMNVEFSSTPLILAHLNIHPGLFFVHKGWSLTPLRAPCNHNYLRHHNRHPCIFRTRERWKYYVNHVTNIVHLDEIVAI